ncbi:hypothetical protein RhiirA5_418252 [Rhizophagus irregularis]|uniref:Uncharacterized protein n=1 Tax=Rhizophagus irregularis TaxID=588596 RepID=A0A2N0PKN9_9GLOM|nr:hypothetical protein RhiirA5_418252 [Rhizophagus irregularis]
MGYVAKHLNGKVIINNERSRDLAWKFGHQQILYLDGTFAAGGAQRASSSYNHLILKELILHYKDKLEQERGCEFVPKQRQLVYYTPDPNRDEAAKRICNEKKIIQVEFNGQTLYLWIVSDTSTQLEPKIYNYSIAS